MADIRQNTVVKDDFNRADEDPLISTPEHPWDNGTIDFAMILENLQLQGRTADAACWTRWVADPQSANGGANVPEIWARRGGGVYTFPHGTRMALFTDPGTPAVDGYAVLATGSFDWILRRYDNGGFTTLATAPPFTYPIAPQLQLMRIVGNDIEVWVDADGTGSTWTMAISATDATYRDDLYMVLGATGNEDAWDDFGGGPPISFLPQIMRYK